MHQLIWSFNQSIGKCCRACRQTGKTAEDKAKRRAHTIRCDIQ
jgi:hypothetical protein